MTTQRRGKVVISNVARAAPPVVPTITTTPAAATRSTADDSGIPNLLAGQTGLTASPAPRVVPTGTFGTPPDATKTNIGGLLRSLQPSSTPSTTVAPPTPIGGITNWLNPGSSSDGTTAPAPPPVSQGGTGLTAIGTRWSPGGMIPIDAPAPPTLSLGQAQGAVAGAAAGDSGASGFVSATLSSAASGDPTGQANAAVLSIAQRLQTLAYFVGQFVGQAQAQQVLTGAHLAG